MFMSTTHLLYIIAIACISLSIIFLVISDSRNTFLFFLEVGLFLAGVIILMHIWYNTGVFEKLYEMSNEIFTGNK